MQYYPLQLYFIEYILHHYPEFNVKISMLEHNGSKFKSFHTWNIWTMHIQVISVWYAIAWFDRLLYIYLMAYRSYLLVCTLHHLIIIINVQTYPKTLKMHVRDILSSVSEIKHILSVQLSIIQYVGLCGFSLPISLVMTEYIYFVCRIIIIKSEVWTIIHCLGLGHETIVCAVCLSKFLCRWFWWTLIF